MTHVSIRAPVRGPGSSPMGQCLPNSVRKISAGTFQLYASPSTASLTAGLIKRKISLAAAISETTLSPTQYWLPMIKICCQHGIEANSQTIRAS